MDLGVLKTELQSWGVKISSEENVRKGGAGPAQGVTLLFNQRQAMVPTHGSFVARSSYEVAGNNGAFYLRKNGEKILRVYFPPTPRFYALKTEAGIPYKKIALLHGKDCLASTIHQDCIYWDSTLRCRFCGIKVSLENGHTVQDKSAVELAEVAAQAYELDHVSHVTLTTGTTNSVDKGLKQLAQAAGAIKGKTALPVHVQCEPPADLKYLDSLYESGVDTVGIHIESFDSAVLSSIAPAKARLGMESFQEAWKRAVELFGRNQVSSFIIVGLGEDPTSIVEGSELLAKDGVYPFIVPLRPIPHTYMENSCPPPPERLIPIYKEVSSIIRRHNLSAQNCKAGCVRCGACSALPDFEGST